MPYLQAVLIFCITRLQESRAGKFKAFNRRHNVPGGTYPVNWTRQGVYSLHQDIRLGVDETRKTPDVIVRLESIAEATGSMGIESVARTSLLLPCQRLILKDDSPHYTTRFDTIRNEASRLVVPTLHANHHLNV